jgi:hypothetical protein
VGLLATIGNQRINFRIHEMAAGPGGAADDFQQLIALLVRETYGEGRMIFSNPGDWGIDVLVGDLSGQVSVWQTKYFMRGVGRAQIDQIRHSFSSAIRAAADHGYTVNMWVICIPTSMDGSALKWWFEWSKKMTEETSVVLQLWDETELRSRLLSPTVSKVCQHCFMPGMEAATAEIYQCLFDIWSAIDNIAERPAGQAYNERLSRLSGINQVDIELSRKTRNDLAHRGHGSVPTATAAQALGTARHVLVRLSMKVTPLPKDL